MKESNGKWWHIVKSHKLFSTDLRNWLCLNLNHLLENKTKQKKNTTGISNTLEVKAKLPCTLHCKMESGFQEYYNLDLFLSL